ncbi:hypothetical protein ABKN59_009208 [Abortiporus biennis]
MLMGACHLDRCSTSTMNRATGLLMFLPTSDIGLEYLSHKTCHMDGRPGRMCPWSTLSISIRSFLPVCPPFSLFIRNKNNSGEVLPVSTLRFSPFVNNDLDPTGRDSVIQDIVERSLLSVPWGKKYTEMQRVLLKLEVDGLVVPSLEGIIGRYELGKQSCLEAVDIILILRARVPDAYYRVLKSLSTAIKCFFRDYPHITGMRHIIYRDQLRKLIDVNFEDLFRSHPWIQSELRSEWRVISQSRSPRLPPELLELVLDCIGSSGLRIGRMDGGDPTAKALMNCCLTCSRFYYWAHCYFYSRKVVLVDDIKLRYFLKNLSRWPSFRELTTEIQLSSNRDAKAKASLPYYEFFLLANSYLLPNLRSLILQGMPILHPAFLYFSHPIPSVRQLRIADCNFCSLTDFRRLASCLFPNLSCMIIGGGRAARSALSFLTYHVNLPPRRRMPKLALSELRLPRIDLTPISTIQEWFLWSEAPLRALWIRFREIHKLSPSFLQSIEILSLDLQGLSFPSHVGSPAPLDVSLLPVLKELVVYIPHPDDIPPFSNALTDSTLSPTLQCIRLWISFPKSIILDNEYSLYQSLDHGLALLPEHIHIEIDEDHYLCMSTTAQGCFGLLPFVFTCSFIYLQVTQCLLLKYDSVCSVWPTLVRSNLVEPG